MKKVISALNIAALLCLLFAGITVDTRQTVALTTKPCVGYTVIAVDKGINCNGDTIALVKQHGYFQFVSKK